MMMPTTLCCCSASLSFHRSLMLCVVSIFQVDGGFLSVFTPLLRRFWRQVLACERLFLRHPSTHSASSTRATRINARKHHKSLHYALLFCVFCCVLTVHPKKRRKYFIYTFLKYKNVSFIIFYCSIFIHLVMT